MKKPTTGETLPSIHLRRGLLASNKRSVEMLLKGKTLEQLGNELESEKISRALAVLGVSKSLAKRIKARAEVEGVSVPDLVSGALSRYLRSEPC